MAGRDGVMSLVCIGNLTIDEAVHGQDRSAPAIGGDAAYAALAARLYLDDVRMLAPVGSDLPPSVLQSLREAGIVVDDLPSRDIPTVRNIIDYFPDGSRRWTMLATEDEFDRLSVYPTDVTDAVLQADGILISAMSLQSQLALTPWLRANTDATLYLDLQEDYLVGNREALFGIIADCDVFLPSEIEAVTLAETDDLAAAAHLFHDLGPRTVVIKRAQRGSIVLHDGTLTEVSSERAVAVDSTGAGDAFCGGFAAVHLVSGDAVDAARCGSAAARTAISAYGIDGLVSAAGALR
ncbi:hypothetical protein B7R21_18945 [Subtercola boreus]|uniref:Carbohydrate kinase PfkB domain-containing protein n=1 Tax=Subtercola boreus TaxID=120213 RepID=A0A3E0VB28_9MICO|nr:carbohydrate kinase family protein [Subtercola boreus]RFA06733.1 hypothetical protein B7R21_18945 [Subtercola boreus]